MIGLFRQVFAAALSIALAGPAFCHPYDAVGNRTKITSTLAPVPAGLFNYDANDRFTVGDTYDANGNTVTSGGIANVYDFENHLIQQGGVTLAYDGDGNRVSKTIAGATTKYLVDTENPTGYAQVVAELTGQFGSVSTVYVYGLEQISQNRRFASSNPISYYVHDGHGSVRALTDPTGALTDSYDYDAFGNLLHSASTQCTTSSGTVTSVALGAACPAGSSPSPTPNNYLYSGEQFDPGLHLYYNRARYLNVTTGRFWTMDSFEGNSKDPTSLHKYLYARNDSVNRIDPSGRDSLIDVSGALAALSSLASQVSIYGQAAFGAFLLYANRIPQLIETANNYVTVGSFGIVLTARLGQMARNLLAFRQQYPPGPGPSGIKIGHVAEQNLTDNSPYLDDYNVADDGKGVGIQLKSASSTDLSQITRFARTAAQDLAARSGKFDVITTDGQRIQVDADNMPYRGLLLALTQDQKSFTPTQLNTALEKIVVETGVIIETVEAEGFVGRK